MPEKSVRRALLDGWNEAPRAPPLAQGWQVLKEPEGWVLIPPPHHFSRLELAQREICKAAQDLGIPGPIHRICPRNACKPASPHAHLARQT